MNGTIPSMLTMWRRHTRTCPHRRQGREYTKCDCPIHCDGEINGRRVRRSLETRNWARAGRKMAELECELACERASKSVEEALARFIAECEIEPSTGRKYSRWARFLAAYAGERGITHIGDFTLEDLDGYADTREVCALTWSKELQFLRSFFAFCEARKWCTENPAKAKKMPKNPKPGERPYKREEIAAILRACDRFGVHAYERLRARAMILLLRYYGLRVSDVATLARARVEGGQIMVSAMKNGELLWLPLYPAVEEALERVPPPRGADPDCGYYFWTGKGSKDGHVKTVDRTLKAVFDASGVANAHAHRFRHTLATEILAQGGTADDAANILGDDVDTIRRYYAKWSPAYQARTREILGRVHGILARVRHTEGIEAVNGLFPGTYGMLEVGVEPTCPVKGAGF